MNECTKQEYHTHSTGWKISQALALTAKMTNEMCSYPPEYIHEYPEMSSISRLAESLQCRINSATSRNSGNVPSSDHSWNKNAYTVTFTYTSPTTTASNDDSPNTLSCVPSELKEHRERTMIQMKWWVVALKGHRNDVGHTHQHPNTST